MPRTTGDWRADLNLNEVLGECESLARIHGHDLPHRPTYSAEDVAEASKRLGIAIPDDLTRFALWLDKPMWARMVNPPLERATSRSLYIMRPDGSIIEPGSEDDNVVVEPLIYEPSSWTLPSPRDESTMLNGTLFKVDILDLRIVPESWADAHFLEFGVEYDWKHLYYCIDVPGTRPGSIAMWVYDSPSVVIVAESLAAWLARIVDHGGTEYFAAGWSELSRKEKKTLTQYFERMNPKSGYMRS